MVNKMPHLNSGPAAGDAGGSASDVGSELVRSVRFGVYLRSLRETARLQLSQKQLVAKLQCSGSEITYQAYNNYETCSRLPDKDNSEMLYHLEKVCKLTDEQIQALHGYLEFELYWRHTEGYRRLKTGSRG